MQSPVWGLPVDVSKERYVQQRSAKFIEEAEAHEVQGASSEFVQLEEEKINHTAVFNCVISYKEDEVRLFLRCVQQKKKGQWTQVTTYEILF